MPLRDHFRPPLDDLRHWEGFHATWPVMIVAQLRRRLPPRYFAEPRVHSGASAEIDVTTFHSEDSLASATGNGNGGIATAVWAPQRPTLTVATDLPACFRTGLPQGPGDPRRIGRWTSPSTP
jgi:hypothetical protein